MNGCQTSYLKLRNPTHLKVFAVQLIIFPAKDKIKNRKHHEKRIWYIYAIMRGHPGEMPTYKTDWSFHLYFVSSPNQCIIYATKKKKRLFYHFHQLEQTIVYTTTPPISAASHSEGIFPPKRPRKHACSQHNSPKMNWSPDSLLAQNSSTTVSANLSRSTLAFAYLAAIAIATFSSTMHSSTMLLLLLS